MKLKLTPIHIYLKTMKLKLTPIHIYLKKMKTYILKQLIEGK
jgi:hypothetical protein